MNIFFKLGEWWERRKALRQSDRLEIYGKIAAINDLMDSRLKAVEQSLLESSKVPTGTANELKAIRIRLDQMELYVGLKREKKPETVPGAARIA